MHGQPVELQAPPELSEQTANALLSDVLRQERARPVVVDCRSLDDPPVIAVARLLRVIEDGRRAGRDVRLAQVPPGLRRRLAGIDADLLAPADAPKRPRGFAALGAWALDAAEAGRRIVQLIGDTLRVLARPFGQSGVKWDRTIEQMTLIGVRGTPIVVFISFLVGVVLALNGAQQLRNFGASIYIANLVAISMSREMAPLITAIVVAGRSGSAIAAELGTMVVSEEIDAMQTMALSPERFLVAPRILALLCMMPLLTVASNAAGIFGGWLIAVTSLGLPSQGYISQTVQWLYVSDVLSGLVKSVVFALIIGFVGVYRGLNVRGGPAGVGLATTASVVTSILLCIVATAVITAILYAAT
ncbi:MAG TPA: ABC transporter permease [Candidatus Limnocylindria bacterium]|nr:ABC transporter permease [Candidatus Limnocylindria bacterium]